MAKSVKMIWVAWVWTVIITLLVTASAQAKHHKKKHPTPTPTPHVRLENPRDVQDRASNGVDRIWLSHLK